MFGVSGPVIASVSPNRRIPGTQVTISGSGFGTAPGSVWLGNASGAVVSWSETPVVATVAPGSGSGFVQILQSGVLSNSVSFALNTPHIMGVSPTAGSPGTVATITGTGFGASQGSGSVRLGT